jgi:ABC-type lipoprotein release transport system permease subunit
VKPHDPVTMAVVAAAMLVAAASAAVVPAWRASRVDPTTALRAE